MSRYGICNDRHTVHVHLWHSTQRIECHITDKGTDGEYAGGYSYRLCTQYEPASIRHVYIAYESGGAGGYRSRTGSIDSAALYAGSGGNMDGSTDDDAGRRKALSDSRMYIDLWVRWRDDIHYITCTDKGIKRLERS